MLRRSTTALVALLLGLCTFTAAPRAQEGEPATAQAPTRYLLIGDSMAWAVAVELEPLLKADGDRFSWQSTISASIRGWGSGRIIRDAVRAKRPDVVLIVLGTNESRVPHPEHLQKPIQSIVRAIGDRPCVWVGPPSWKDEQRLVQVLRDNVAPCRFLDSSTLDLPRRPDGVHPNREGSRRWARAVYTALQEQPMTEATLQIQEILPGVGALAESGHRVTVHYTGWLTDGTTFDSSHNRKQPFVFQLGGRQVIAGWDQGVAGMRVGGKRRLTIPPHLGYGARGAGGVIPPNATLVFEVELLGVE